MGIVYVDGPRLRRSLMAAAEWVEAGREELNRINVFPVPDGDTGTNFALTLRAVAQALAPLENAHLPVVTKAMADACVLSAHGNSGMLLSQFLLGFREGIGDRHNAGPTTIAAAFRTGADRLHAALDEPIEGTILTVCRETADAAERAASATKDFKDFMSRTLSGAHEALRKTPELLAVLKQAGVVDAGGKGFVRLLEGVVRLMDGAPVVASSSSEDAAVPAAAALTVVEQDRDYRWCTEVLVRGTEFPPSTELRAALRPLGGSIVVLSAESVLKVHIHTNSPEAVYDKAGAWGLVEQTKADDMRVQHQVLHDDAVSDLGIVVDSTCDLPDETIDRYGFVLAPIQITDGTRTYLDRIEISPAEIYRRMRREKKTPFTTSQPTPAAFAEAYQDARSNAREALCLTLSSGLSGTFASAQSAVAASGLDGITIFDSRSISVGLGMLALRARELAEAGMSTSQLTEELVRVRERSGGFVVVGKIENLVRSGRVSRGRGWLGRLLNITPILELSPRDGKVAPIDRVRGSKGLISRVLEHIDRRLTPRPVHLRLGVVHADAEETAQAVCDEVQRRFRPRECLFADATAALGVHVGPGTWAVFYQIEEPGESRQDDSAPEPQ
jgi:DegV family protein with EDD domain